MSNKKSSKFFKLVNRYWPYLLTGLIITILCIFFGVWILADCEQGDTSSGWYHFGNVLLTVGETILGAGLIGGGIGGSINFIFEELKKEEEDVKNRLKGFQEGKERRKQFRLEMQSKLQMAYDNVELARVLIKSHKSGKTYGEQIRNRIMPSLIALQDFRRGLAHVEDLQLEEDLDYLQVSLNYQIAYLSVLIEEFEANYVNISNLQNYQDALANRMRMLFTEVAEGMQDGIITLAEKKQFLESAEQLFGDAEVPSNIEVVWQAIEDMDYVSDFINELRDEKGQISLYNQYFLQHYAHCNKILKTKDSDVNKKLVARKNFIANVEELKRIEEKKNSDLPITLQDNLMHQIMEKELRFDFATKTMRK